jgi:hypothetical protein
MNMSCDLNESQAEHSHLKMNIHSQQSELQSLKSQLIFMNELIEQKQGYPEGAKTILSNKSSYDGEQFLRNTF